MFKYGVFSKACLGPCQTPIIKFFVNKLSYLGKKISIKDVLKGLKYTSDSVFRESCSWKRDAKMDQKVDLSHVFHSVVFFQLLLKSAEWFFYLIFFSIYTLLSSSCTFSQVIEDVTLIDLLILINWMIFRFFLFILASFQASLAFELILFAISELFWQILTRLTGSQILSPP